MTQVWSATQINGNLTGGGTTTVDYTVGGGGTIASVYAGTGVSSGKYYWEAKLTAANATSFTNGSTAFGLGNTSTSVASNDYVGIGLDSVGIYFTSGGINVDWYVNNNPVANYSLGFTVASGDVFGFALDLTNNTLWFRDVTQGSGWFGLAGSADPATNTNGFSLVQTNFTITSNPVVPGASLLDNGDEVVGFFSPASWTGVVPSGFAGFDAAVTLMSGKYAGSGTLRANRAVVRALASSRFGGSGALVANATFAPNISAAFAGRGALTANATLSSSFVSAAFRGSGAMAARLAAQEVATAGYSGTGAITAVTSISLGSSQLAAVFAGAGSLSMPRSITLAVDSPAYVGAGTFATDVTIYRATIPVSAAFLGGGSLVAAPIVLSTGRATFAATGAITANAVLPGRVNASATFSAAGSLILPRLTAPIKISTAYRGAGTIASSALVGTPTSTTNVVDQLGNQIVDQLGNIVVTEFQPPSQVTTIFNGTGSLSATSTLRVSGVATYTGAGSFVTTSRIISLVSGVATYTGSGSFATPATSLSVGIATYTGSGSFSAPATLLTNGIAGFTGSGSFVAPAAISLLPSGTSTYTGTGSFVAPATVFSVGRVRYAGSGSFVASATISLLPVGAAGFAATGSFAATSTTISSIFTAVASFAGSGSLAARNVASLRGQVRFAGAGTFSTGLGIPQVLARCFGADVGVFFPPSIADASRFGQVAISDAARNAAPLIWLKDAQVRFVAASDAARGLSATTDIAAARSTSADVPATSIAVAET